MVSQKRIVLKKNGIIGLDIVLMLATLFIIWEDPIKGEKFGAIVIEIFKSSAV